jgi:hypothetical protein
MPDKTPEITRPGNADEMAGSIASFFSLVLLGYAFMMNFSNFFYGKGPGRYNCFLPDLDIAVPFAVRLVDTGICPKYDIVAAAKRRREHESYPGKVSSPDNHGERKTKEAIMTEEAAAGCARPTGGPVAEEATQDSAETHNVIKEERRMVMVGQKAPDFVAPGYQKGKFVNIKLSDYLGKWVLLCFYPGDFTFV